MENQNNDSKKKYLYKTDPIMMKKNNSCKFEVENYFKF